MKKLMLSLIVLLSFSNPSLSAWTDGEKKIYRLKVDQSGNVIVSLSGFTNTSSSIVCSKDQFIMRPSHDGYSSRLSLLLSAYLSERLISISYYDCDANYIKLGSIEIKG